jgi:erythromycin esterase
MIRPGAQTAVVLLLVCAPVLAQNASRHRAIVPPRPVPLSNLAQWIAATGIPFSTTEPVDDDRDLLPLMGVVGDTQYVGVGEATHGTHEFFSMKHRLFRFLVERMGFTVFAMEAGLPECDKINAYVHGGPGNPATLVHDLGYWTWYTDEVIDLVEWMRGYNLAHPERHQLSFRGFDMQDSKVAIAAIREYVQQVDPANASAHISRLACANVDFDTYLNLPLAARNTCRQSVGTEYTAISAARTAYVAASSTAAYERILRYARVVVQFEDFVGHAQSPFDRDPYMAENAEWLAETDHPGEKMMLWAHNFHIGVHAGYGSMGSFLRTHWAARYLPTGFLFDFGDFNAYDGDTLILESKHVDPAPTGGLEPYFRETGQNRLIIDLRRPDAAVASDLSASRTVWLIGAVVSSTDSNRAVMIFNQWFDVAIWVTRSTPSRLRPF